MKLTFLDTGVLISAIRGNSDIAARAFKILDDPLRRFASSDFIKLELVPKATFHGRREQVEFYEVYFSNVSCWAPVSVELIETACREACMAGLNALDSLHVAAALRLSADELVTVEKAGKPLSRVSSIPVISIITD